MRDTVADCRGMVCCSRDGEVEDAVSEQLGAVFCVDSERAAFVAFAEIDAYDSLAQAFGRVPTVAGPPLDLATLEDLRNVLVVARGMVPQPPGGHPLTPEQASYLDLLSIQSALRARLPLRLHRTCTACGTKKIINPARPKATTAEKAGDVANAIVGLANLAQDPLGGFLDIMGGMGSKQSAGAVLCEHCEGFEFELPAITFCPSCKALRTESVLVTCPDCRTDFAVADAQPRWVPLADAQDAARLTDLRRRVGAACGRLTNGVYPEQQRALLATLVPADEPRCLFRSSRPGDSTRSTVLMATSRQLVFVRETMAGKAISDRINWTDVIAVRHYAVPKTGRDTTIQLDTVAGTPLLFSRIGEPSQNLAADGILDSSTVARELATLAGVTLQGAELPPVPMQPQAAQVSAAPAVVGGWAPVPPTPSMPQAPSVPHMSSLPPTPPAPGAGLAAVSVAAPPSEQPGWYPDPWRQARIRWWDGTTWTGHVSA